MIAIIIEQAFIFIPLVIGAYVSISLMKLPDLSIESAFTFGAIVSSKFLLLNTAYPALAVGGALLGGAAVGLVSSMLTQRIKIPHLLSSIITMGLFHGINQVVLGPSLLSLSPVENILACCPIMTTHPELSMLAMIGVFLCGIFYLFLKTQIGCCLIAYGNNPRFFEHYRISGSFIFFIGVVVANALAGLSGYLVAQTSGFVDTGMGGGMALFCITALILGKTIMVVRKQALMLMPVVGVTSYFVVQQLLLRCGFNLKYFTMVQALMVLAIICFSFRKQRATRSQQMIDTLGV